VAARCVPNQAQADFGEAQVVIAGADQKAHFFVLDLPHSDDCLVVTLSVVASDARLVGTQ
jgi:hypothetical protein